MKRYVPFRIGNISFLMNYRSIAYVIGLVLLLSLIHISEPTRQAEISYAVFCLKKIFLMIRRPPRSTPLYSSAASDVYKRQRVIFI